MKVAVIGSGGHVGFPFALVCAQAGHKVYAIDRNEELLIALDKIGRAHV